MNSPQIIKRIEPMECPLCKGTLYVGYQSMLPAISIVSTIKDITEAKQKIIENLKVIKFKNEEEEKNVMDYLNNENTLLDKSDIESITSQIAKKQVEEISKEKNEKPDKGTN